MVVAVGDVKARLPTESDVCGVVEACLGSCSVEEAECAGTCEGGDAALGGDLADAVVVAVGDVEVSAGVKGKAGGGVEARLIGRTIGETLWASSSEGGDIALGGDFADAVVAHLGDVEVSVGVKGEASGEVETGLGGGAVGKGQFSRDGFNELLAAALLASAALATGFSACAAMLGIDLRIDAVSIAQHKVPVAHTVSALAGRPILAKVVAGAAVFGVGLCVDTLFGAAREVGIARGGASAFLTDLVGGARVVASTAMLGSGFERQTSGGSAAIKARWTATDARCASLRSRARVVASAAVLGVGLCIDASSEACGGCGRRA